MGVGGDGCVCVCVGGGGGICVGASGVYVLSCITKERGAIDFTCQAITLFERRYENGYDLTHVVRYNLWLTEFHPDKG